MLIISSFWPTFFFSSRRRHTSYIGDWRRVLFRSNARPPRKRGSGQRPDPRTMRLRLFLEVEPQAHLNVSGRIVLVTGNTKGARPGYVHARLVREIRITSTAEHDVVEGVDKLYVKPCGEAFGDARHLR